MVTNADGEVFPIPVQRHLQPFGAGIGSVVQQVQQSLGQVRRRRHAGDRALAEALEAITGFRAHQVPAIEGFIEPIGDVLHLHRQPTIGLGGAHQLLQGLLAQLDLILQHAQVVLQHRIMVVLTHFLE
ncbi:hypothetical protein D3C87_1557380 [compost metagenome]